MNTEKKGENKMKAEEAKKEIELRFESYLNAKGINTQKKFQCLNPEHPDRNPSMAYVPQMNKCYCYSCGTTYDIFNIIGLDYGTSDFMETLKIGSQIFDIPFDGNNLVKKPLKEIKKIKAKKSVPAENRKSSRKAADDVCDKVYKNLKALSPLTDDDRKYLAKVRGLSENRIKADYFRLKNEPEDREIIIRQLKKLTGYTNDVLKFVPGFFVRKETGALDYYEQDGIAILIHNVKGQAIAVQIRRDTAEKGRRYTWFTSSFAVNNNNYAGGASPGAAKDILVPKNPKKTLCVTEGRFKSEILAQHDNIVISLQGATTWKGIESDIESLISEHDITSLFLFFDSDIMGNYQLLKSVKKFYFHVKDKFKGLKIITATWKIEYGKGIDDCFIAGNEKMISYLKTNVFLDKCQQGYEIALEHFNLKSAKKISGDIAKDFKEFLQQTNEEILFGRDYRPEAA